MEKQKRVRLVSLLIYSIGILVGLIFIGLSTWADFESILFDSSLTAEKRFSSLRCPVFIGSRETAVLTGSVRNPIDRPIKPRIRAHISSGMATMMREIDMLPEIAPSEKLHLEWTVDKNDAVWGHFILFRVYQFRTYPVPSSTASCGIYFINLPVPGIVITILFILFSIILMGVGLWMWYVQNKPLIGRKREVTVALSAVAILICFGIFFSLLAQMAIGAAIFIIIIVLIVVINSYFALTA